MAFYFHISHIRIYQNDLQHGPGGGSVLQHRGSTCMWYACVCRPTDFKLFFLTAEIVCEIHSPFDMGKVKILLSDLERCEITQFLINTHTSRRALTSVYSFARCEILKAAVPQKHPLDLPDCAATVLCAGLFIHTVNKITWSSEFN
jgi:hypothetical protein